MNKIFKNISFQIIQKTILSLLTLVILYSNVAIIFGHLPKIKRPPIDPVSHYLFNIFSVFSSYVNSNYDYILWAHTRDNSTGKEQWERLETKEYFPFKRGEQHARMLIRLHKFNLPSQEYNAVQERMMAKVLQKYNRQHTDKLALKMALTQEWWPLSRRDYEEYRTAELIRIRYLFWNNKHVD